MFRSLFCQNSMAWERGRQVPGFFLLVGVLFWAGDRCHSGLCLSLLSIVSTGWQLLLLGQVPGVSLWGHVLGRPVLQNSITALFPPQNEAGFVQRITAGRAFGVRLANWSAGLVEA